MREIVGKSVFTIVRANTSRTKSKKIGRMQNRESNSLVHVSSKTYISIESYARKTGFSSVYSGNWRVKHVFPILSANERENQKSKENRILQIQRAFE